LLKTVSTGQLESAARGDASRHGDDEPLAGDKCHEGGRYGHEQQRERIEQGDVLDALEAAFRRRGGHGGIVAG
jgi:hypothetical protein